MVLIGIDLSSKTGYAVLNDGKLMTYGLLTVELKNFNVNNNPNLQPEYPWNIIDAAIKQADQVIRVILDSGADHVALENTTKGRNRHTQRILEFLHYALLIKFRENGIKFTYLDPSQWRGELEIRLSIEDKKKHKDIKKGIIKRGKITKKHLSVRAANTMYGLKLLQKDNDIADAIGLATALYKINEK